ncbi:MAG: heavy metal-associated domain-containing protein, partial [Kiritimatiellae bacterium]|nr:heavy metal-associated domain-containing protein [Kiritimatiellia bacterium]
GVTLLSGCRVSDVREMTVNVPGMTSEADAQKIHAALSQLIGLDKDKTSFDIATRTVLVRYDSMQIAHKNIEIAIAETGYDANSIKAIPKNTTK